jgi:site-specific recombinase XerD
MICASLCFPLLICFPFVRPKSYSISDGGWGSAHADQVKVLVRAPNVDTMRGKRDRAIIAILVGCGLRRSEVADLKLGDIQQRDERWIILDLYGKGGHIRTVPIPEWVKAAVDCWTTQRK